jgi:hypothetical protein
MHQPRVPPLEETLETTEVTEASDEPMEEGDYKEPKHVGTCCPWWPSFLGNPSLGARSLHRETGSKICAATAPVLGPDHACRCRGPGGIILTARGLAGEVLVGNIMHLLLTAAVPTGV